ncbi:MAG: alpha/beta hydrolase [Patescibacteria group bacterium]|nr:alpha/beta hydrolase [Patescibacteria group bacterium]
MANTTPEPILLVLNPIAPFELIFFGLLRQLLRNLGYNAHILKVGIPRDITGHNLFTYYTTRCKSETLRIGRYLDRPITLVGLSAGGEICLETASFNPEFVNKIILLDSYLFTEAQNRVDMISYRLIIAYLKALAGLKNNRLDNLGMRFLFWTQAKAGATFRQNVAAIEMANAGFDSLEPSRHFDELRQATVELDPAYLAKAMEDWLITIANYDYESRINYLQDRIYCFPATANAKQLKGKIKRVSKIRDCQHIVPLDRPITCRDIIADVLNGKYD